MLKYFWHKEMEKLGKISNENYEGTMPCCGIFCGNCPNYTREKDKCFGADGHCEKRKCGIYKCCIEKKEIKFCFECKAYPCFKFKRFAETWKKLGQDLYDNQRLLKEIGRDN